MKKIVIFVLLCLSTNAWGNQRDYIERSDYISVWQSDFDGKREVIERIPFTIRFTSDFTFCSVKILNSNMDCIFGDEKDWGWGASGRYIKLSQSDSNTIKGQVVWDSVGQSRIFLELMKIAKLDGRPLLLGHVQIDGPPIGFENLFFDHPTELVSMTGYGLGSASQ